MKNLELRSRKDNEIKVKDNNRYSSGKTENYKVHRIMVLMLKYLHPAIIGKFSSIKNQFHILDRNSRIFKYLFFAQKP